MTILTVTNTPPKKCIKACFKTILRKKGKCLTMFYKYVRGVKEIGKIFQRSQLEIVGLLQIR